MSWIRQRFEAARARLRPALPLIPWLSLVAGVVGACLMERSPRTSLVVFAAALLGWGAVLTLGLFATAAGEPARNKAARLLVTWLTQNLMQQCLFFVIPFYVMSSSMVWGHLAFNIVLISVTLMTLWDPLFEAMVKTLPRRVLLQSFVIFVTLHAVGPFLGLSNQVSLYLSTTLAAFGAPCLAYKVLAARNRFKLASMVFGAAAFGLTAFALVGAPTLLPPAPFKLVRGGLGTSYRDHQLIGKAVRFDTTASSIVCASSVEAPTSIRGTVFHVWSVNGHVSDRIPLRIRGGREKGFRTYSRKKRLSPGIIGCQVETATGQIIATYEASLSPS